MTQRRSSIEISKPVADVFAIVKDASQAPHWLSQCVELRQTSFGQKSAGATLHYTYRQGAKAGDMEGIVSAYVRNARLAMTLHDNMFEVSLVFQFTATPSGTRMDFSCSIELGNFLAKMMSSIIATAIQKHMQQDLAALKRLLEKGASG